MTGQARATSPDAHPLASQLVSVEISHTYINDLTFDVTGPSGARATLFAGSCPTNGGANNINAVFDDQAANAIACVATAPALNGTFRPAGALAALATGSIAGNFVFSVRDGAADDLGTLTRWCIRPAFVGDLIWKNNFTD